MGAAARQKFHNQLLLKLLYVAAPCFATSAIGAPDRILMMGPSAHQL